MSQDPGRSETQPQPQPDDDATETMTTESATAADDLRWEQPATEPPVGEPPVADPPARTGVSVPTVIWGLVLALIAGSVIAGQVSDRHVDVGVSAPIVLLAAGFVLVAWGVAGIGRTRRR